MGCPRSSARRWRATLSPAILAAAAVALAACSADPAGPTADAAAAAEAERASAAATRYAWPTGPHPQARLIVTGYGDIVIDLYPELAPETVANFVKLAQSGFYDGTTFHRVVKGMMVQGGDPNSKDKIPANDGQGDSGYNIRDEFTDAPHVRGVLSMANTGRPNSGGSQFFLVHQDALFLDGRHAVFGKVVAGLDTVDSICEAEVDKVGRWGPQDRPLENIVIEKVEIDGAGTPGESNPLQEMASASRS